MPCLIRKIVNPCVKGCYPIFRFIVQKKDLPDTFGIYARNTQPASTAFGQGVIGEKKRVHRRGIWAGKSPVAGVPLFRWRSKLLAEGENYNPGKNTIAKNLRLVFRPLGSVRLFTDANWKSPVSCCQSPARIMVSFPGETETLGEQKFKYNPLPSVDRGGWTLFKRRLSPLFLFSSPWADGKPQTSLWQVDRF